MNEGVARGDARKILVSRCDSTTQQEKKKKKPTNEELCGEAARWDLGQETEKQETHPRPSPPSCKLFQEFPMDQVEFVLKPATNTQLLEYVAHILKMQTSISKSSLK